MIEYDPARVRRRWLSGLALLYSAVHFAITGLGQSLHNFYGDFLASFPAWKVALLCGRLDLYRGSLANRWGPPPIWHYGPVQHLVTLPLFAFPTLRSAYVAWLFVNVAFVAVTIVLAARVTGNALVAVILFLNFNPLYEALTQRTIELFELMLLFAAYVLYTQRRDVSSGVAIGIAAMTKFLPLIYLPWLVLKRRWRVLAGSLAAIVPIAVGTQCVLGWQNSGIVKQLRRGSFLRGELNQSVSGVVIRVLKGTRLAPSAANISRVVIVAALIALSLLMVRCRRAGAHDLEYGLLAVAMVLLLPHNQNYYFVFLLLPYVLLYALYRPTWPRRAWLPALSCFLVAMPFPLSVVTRISGVDAFGIYLRAAIPFAGATILAGVLVNEMILRERLEAAVNECRIERGEENQRHDDERERQ